MAKKWKIAIGALVILSIMATIHILSRTDLVPILRQLHGG